MSALVWRRLSTLPLRARVTLGTLILFVAATVVQIHLIGQWARTSALNEFGDRVDTWLNFGAERLRGEIAALRQDVAYLAETRPIQGIARASHNNGIDPLEDEPMEIWQARLAQIFMAFSSADPLMYQVRYIGIADGGRELVRVDQVDGHAVTRPEIGLQSKSDRDYFQATLALGPGDIYVSEINLNQEYGRVVEPHVRTIRASTPVFTDDGALFGMIVINRDLGPALDAVSENMPNGWHAYLMNEVGDYLIHPDSSRTFGFDLGARHRWQDDVSDAQAADRVHVTHELGLQAFELGNALLRGENTRVFFDPGRPERHLDLVYALSNTTVRAMAAQARRPILAGALLTAAGFIVFFYLYVGRIFVPLTDLTRAARLIGKGAYDTPLPEHASGEIGSFVEAFGQMIADVRRRDEINQRLNAEIAQRERFARLVVDAAPDAVLIADTEGRIIQANAQCESVLGYVPAELAGRPVETLMPERFRRGHEGLRAAYQADPDRPQREMGAGRELYARCKDGSEIRVEIGLGPMTLDREEFVIVAMTDITERVEALESLRVNEKRLKRSNAELEQFAYIASHDLQEPLRSIAGPLQLLKQRYGDKIDESADTFIDHAVAGAERMRQLINDLLSYSRAARRGDAVAEPVDCNALMEEVVAALKAMIEEIGAKVTWDPLPVVPGVSAKLYELFQNLVANALKFRGDEPPRVHVSAQRIEASVEGGPGWEFVVEDNGIGIERKYLEDVFKVFRRLHTRSAYEGTGIGLALCKRIVESHGGHIWAESEPGNGTRFCFRLGEDGQTFRSANEKEFSA